VRLPAPSVSTTRPPARAPRLLSARKAGRGYAVSEADVAAWRRLGQEPVRPSHVRDGRPGHRALYAAIVQGQENAARHRLDRLADGVNLIDLCERVIAPALRRVGDDWAAGRVSIAQEHRASAICERLLATYAG